MSVYTHKKNKKGHVKAVRRWLQLEFLSQFWSMKDIMYNCEFQPELRCALFVR